jgi:predicted lipid-binding transport protein (Tim44 family)
MTLSQFMGSLTGGYLIGYLIGLFLPHISPYYALPLIIVLVLLNSALWLSF